MTVGRHGLTVLPTFVKLPGILFGSRHSKKPAIVRRLLAIKAAILKEGVCNCGIIPGMIARARCPSAEGLSSIRENSGKYFADLTADTIRVGGVDEQIIRHFSLLVQRPL